MVSTFPFHNTVNCVGVNLKMTIDKFGRHIIHKHHNKSKIYLAQNISQLNYETMFHVLGQETDVEGRYILINGLKTYTFKLTTGTITMVDINPPNVNVFVNGVEYSTIQLIGITLNQGDQLTFKWNKNRKTFFSFEAVLKVPFLR